MGAASTRGALLVAFTLPPDEPYLSAGVTSIELDANRIAGPSDVSLRLLLFGPGGTWASTNLAPTLTGPGWQHLSFGLSAADLTYVPGSFAVPDGTGILADTLSDVTLLLVRHDRLIPTIPGNHPPHITATLGLDNITAVPEPSTLVLLCMGAVGLFVYGWRRRRG